LDRHRLALRPLDAWDEYWKSNPRRTEIIISLTTIPSRLPALEPTIKSLLYQTRSAQRIRVYLPWRSLREDRSYEIPDFLNRLRAVDIVRCDDSGPATKFYPALQEFPPDQAILIVDDDRLYPPGFVDDFYHWTQRYPDIAIGAAGWIVPSDLTDRELTFWRNLWLVPPAPIKSTRIHTLVAVHILEGYAGYLIKPRFFDLDQLGKYGQAPDAAFYVDDVWMSAHCRVPRYVIPADRHAFNDPRGRHFDQAALWRINNGQGVPERRNNTLLIRHFRERWTPLKDSDGSGKIQRAVHTTADH
jgi:hypothetical protein